ncbi:hypothetical protein AsAng_0017460 [Aureispira anguillae]|uniref:Uncharacterized protein n=1 Tax=Aureispira anguillae TaxID=2864201 RepID=A0A916DS67_9BACT|nr:hypothetical protein AsAng_0017460 [Aureispira anguillae]
MTILGSTQKRSFNRATREFIAELFLTTIKLEIYDKIDQL